MNGTSVGVPGFFLFFIHSLSNNLCQLLLASQLMEKSAKYIILKTFSSQKKNQNSILFLALLFSPIQFNVSLKCSVNSKINSSPAMDSNTKTSFLYKKIWRPNTILKNSPCFCLTFIMLIVVIIRKKYSNFSCLS